MTLQKVEWNPYADEQCFPSDQVQRWNRIAAKRRARKRRLHAYAHEKIYNEYGMTFLDRGPPGPGKKRASYLSAGLDISMPFNRGYVLSFRVDAKIADRLYEELETYNIIYKNRRGRKLQSRSMAARVCGELGYEVD